MELFTTSSDEPETVDIPDVPAASGAPILSSSSEKTGGNKSSLRAMKLQCGHLFCHGCLSEFLKTNEGKKCPVCRAPVTGERPEPGAPPPGTHVPQTFPINYTPTTPYQPTLSPHEHLFLLFSSLVNPTIFHSHHSYNRIW